MGQSGSNIGAIFEETEWGGVTVFSQQYNLIVSVDPDGKIAELILIRK